MKKAVLLLFILTTPLAAQNVYFTFQPQDKGVGIRYDHPVKDHSIYGVFSKGKYQLQDDNTMSHLKGEIGLVVNTAHNTFINGGISWNSYKQLRYEALHPRAVNPISMSFGAGAYLGRVVIASRFDPLKWEGCIDVGFKILK